MRKPATKPADTPRGRTLLIVGVCKPGLAILTLAYLLLLLSVLLTILYPHSLAGKMVSLVAYALITGFFSYKAYNAVNAPVVKERRRKATEVTTEVTGTGQKSNETVTILSIDEPPSASDGEEQPPERSPTDADTEADARGRKG